MEGREFIMDESWHDISHDYDDLIRGQKNYDHGQFSMNKRSRRGNQGFFLWFSKTSVLLFLAFYIGVWSFKRIVWELHNRCFEIYFFHWFFSTGWLKESWNISMTKARLWNICSKLRANMFGKEKNWSQFYTLKWPITSNKTYNCMKSIFCFSHTLSNNVSYKYVAF